MFIRYTHKILFSTIAILFFSSTVVPLVGEESIQIHILPNERFESFYEIYVPKGIKGTKNKYFYVHVSVGQESIGASGEKTLTAIATFEGVQYHKMSIVKMMQTKDSLRTINRKYISRSSPYYPLVKKAIRKSLREYDSWQQKFDKAFKDIALPSTSLPSHILHKIEQ